ncbi:hypothetical protein PR048_007729 [Dryococelus australis]|uniref:Uncharacterized protein n=1 Tax=Dryococelus australis TaxID=614101 RepID=A0ABQ9HV25_9NEOP|nr:hypothetical protein PR048_007729 [Dryococelus australis]
MEQRRNAKVKKGRSPRKSAPTSGIVRHDSHVRKCEGGPVGERTPFALRVGRRPSSLTTTPQRFPHGKCQGGTRERAQRVCNSALSLSPENFDDQVWWGGGGSSPRHNSDVTHKGTLWANVRHALRKTFRWIKQDLFGATKFMVEEYTMCIQVEHKKGFQRFSAYREHSFTWTPERWAWIRVARAGVKGRPPRKPCRPAASSGTIPTLRKSGVTRPGIELGSTWWEVSSLATQPPRPRRIWGMFEQRDVFVRAFEVITAQHRGEYGQAANIGGTSRMPFGLLLVGSRFPRDTSMARCFGHQRARGKRPIDEEHCVMERVEQRRNEEDGISPEETSETMTESTKLAICKSPFKNFLPFGIRFLRRRTLKKRSQKLFTRGVAHGRLQTTLRSGWSLLAPPFRDVVVILGRDATLARRRRRSCCRELNRRNSAERKRDPSADLLRFTSPVVDNTLNLHHSSQPRELV